MARGSVRQRGDAWQLRAYVGVDHLGKSRYKVETVRGTRADADRRLRALMDEIDRGAHRSADRALDELITAWLEAHPPTQGAPLTHINRYLRPELGRIRLSRLDPATIDGFYGRLRKGGVKGHPLSGTYVRRIHTTLNVILSQGVKWGWLACNPAELASPPTGQRQAPEPPDVAQVKALLDEAA